MKKILAVFVIGFTLLLLGACTEYSATQFGLNSDEEVLSFSAMSASSLLTNYEMTDPLLSSDTMSIQLSGSLDTINEGDTVDETDDTVTTEEEKDQAVENVEKFLKLIEMYTSGKQTLATEDQVSDNVLYEHMLVISTLDMLGETVTYTLYYNQTLEGDETDEVEETDDLDEVDEEDEADLDDEEDEADQDDDEDKDEFEYTIEGILVYNDQTFTISGEKEIEADESSLEFTAYIDENNYITSEYEFEENESKFYITEVKDGVVFSETEIELESEEDEEKIELTYILGEDTYAYEFKFETEDGRPALKVEYETYVDGVSDEGEIMVYIVIDEVTQETSYEIAVDDDKDGEEDYRYSEDRDDDDDDDEDEEDEEDDEDDDDTESES